MILDEIFVPKENKNSAKTEITMRLYFIKKVSN